MVFSDLSFIFVFLPVFFIIYYLVPKNMRNLVIVVGSFIFYLVGSIDNPEHIVIFLISILVDYYVALMIEENPEHKKMFLTLCIIFHVLCLGTFKYSNFVLGEINKRFLDNTLLINIIQPIGISFYTFQGISYVVDVYRRKFKAERNIIDFVTYISMFEQLIAGPIVTYEKVEKDLHYRKVTSEKVKNGVGIFIIGLGLKVLLANPIGKLWTQTCNIGFESISTPLAWMAIFAFTFQIYFDFFGYSLMAIGLGKMLGFRIPVNFRHPYLSCSMTEFWRRWHITLGSWFREYVYIPLGGNRKGIWNTIRNLFFVWLLTGLWHGAGYNFLIWGCVLFLIIVLEKYFIGKYLNDNKIMGHLYMMLIIPLTWAIFAINDVNQLGVFFLRLFPVGSQGPWSAFSNDYIKYFGMYFPFFIFALLFSTKLPFKLFKKIKNKIVKNTILLFIFAASVYCLYKGFDDPFLYFRF